jgi:hypothetical protein
MEDFSRIDARSEEAISFIANSLAKNVFYFLGHTSGGNMERHRR